MPSLIQDSFGAGYGLVRDNSTSIVALGNAGGGGGGPTNGLLQEDGLSYVLAENNDYLVQE